MVRLDPQTISSTNPKGASAIKMNHGQCVCSSRGSNHDSHNETVKAIDNIYPFQHQAPIYKQLIYTLESRPEKHFFIW